jgi:thiol:disulfide interchange protein DsbD
MSLLDHSIAGQCRLRGRAMLRHSGQGRLQKWAAGTLVWLLLSFPFPAGAQAVLTTTAGSEAVDVSVAWSVNHARPGDRFVLAVLIDVRQGFHINGDASQIRSLQGFSPFATRVTAREDDERLHIGAAQFPRAHPIKVGFTESELMVFDGRTVVFLPMELSADSRQDVVRVKLEIAYQACDTQMCLFPQTVRLVADLPVVPPGTPPSSANQALFSEFSETASVPTADQVGFSLFGMHFALDAASGGGMLLLLLIAMLGGTLLNFTPCVLPLVPIKIMSLSMAAHTRSRCLTLGLAMSLGILAFWLGLGAAIATLSGFTAVNQLFQFPAFTIFVGLVIGVMGLGMWRTFPINLPGFLYAFNPRPDTFTGSVSLGILTAVLSTPCTAPFMGAAAAWATTRHPTTTLLTFAAIGSGMALPYLLLSAVPNLTQKMPRTGPASALIKQAMGLCMLAAAAYFVGSGLSALMASPPNPPGKQYWWVVMGFVAAGGLWTAFRTMRIARSNLRRALFVVLGVIVTLVAVGGAIRLTSKGPIDWVYFTPQRFQEALDRRQTIVLVFTAEWCLNCKALEQGVLQTPAVVRLLAENDVAPIKVDITGNNAMGKAKLKEVGRLTIPLLIVYTPLGEEVFRSDFYTAEQIIAAVEKARFKAGIHTLDG